MQFIFKYMHESSFIAAKIAAKIRFFNITIYIFMKLLNLNNF